MASEARILVVDDEPGMCWALEKVLQAEGYQTMAASTGQEALELTQEEPLDIALIDVVLPDMDGIDLAGLIREVCPDIVVIVISGCLSEGDKVIEEALELGTICKFLSKPFELAEVRLAVKTAVEGS